MRRRHTSRGLAWAWSRRWAALALVALLTIAVVVVRAQPVRSPWWTYADADASYAASALNLLLGEPVGFVDHPGVPVTQSATLAFGVDAVIAKRSLSKEARRAYVDDRLVDLDRARTVFRGLAIAFYFAGVLLSFVLVTRLFGHWVWGLAAGLLWLAVPGLLAMSIQLRPDVPLAVLCLVFGYLVGRGLETRSTAFYSGAAFVAGFAFMVKLHAVGLLAPLGLALAWRRPLDRWRPSSGAVLAATSALAVPAVLLNWARLPFDLREAQWQVLAMLVAGVLISIALARVSALGVVAVAFVAGVGVPVVLSVPEGLQGIVNAAVSMSGRGVQEGVEPFSTPLSRIDDIVGDRALIVFLLAALAGVVGLIRREPQPVVWGVGAFVMGLLVFVRPPNVHYFAPAFVLSTLGMLWLFHRGRLPTQLLVWPVVLLIVWPAYRYRESPAAEAERFAGVVTASKAVVDARLESGEFAYVPSYWPFADARHFELVHIYVGYVPPYTYRYLPATVEARKFADDENLRPRYYVGPQAAEVTGLKRVALGDAGTFTVRRLPGTDLVLEIVGP